MGSFQPSLQSSPRAATKARHRRQRGPVSSPTATLFGLLGSTLIAGCGLVGSSDCTSEGRPALSVVITDSRTQHRPTVGSQITVTDGPFVETYPPPGSPLVIADGYAFAFERPGRYSILIYTAGYHDWSRSDIVVTTGDCRHVNTITVTARLTPLTP